MRKIGAKLLTLLRQLIGTLRLEQDEAAKIRQVQTDIIKTLRSASEDQKAQLDGGQEIILPIHRPFLLRMLRSEDEEDRQIVNISLQEINQIIKYKLEILPGMIDMDDLIGLSYDYFLLITLQPLALALYLGSDEGATEEIVEAVAEQPKVLTMAAGAGKR